MKKLYMCTIIGSSWRNCVLIILFQLYGSNGGFFECNLFGVGQYDSSTFILEEETVLYLEIFWSRYVGLGFLVQTLKLSKLCSSTSPTCALSVLSYSECKIANIFPGFAPGQPPKVKKNKKIAGYCAKK